MHTSIAAMHKTGIRRLLQVYAFIVANQGESPYMRYLVKPVALCTFLREVRADMRPGEDEIRDSDLDWTMIRLRQGCPAIPPTSPTVLRYLPQTLIRAAIHRLP